MYASELVDQYLNATDNDLKYMALRQDLTICELEQDVDLLVKKVLLPVLVHETDPEIIELVSSQTYPQLAENCIEKMSIGVESYDLQWFDDLIVEPLIEQMATKRAGFVVQTLRNLFKVVIKDDTKTCSPTEKYVKQLIAQMKLCEGKNMVIYWETLGLMISAYYNSITRMNYDVLTDIFHLYMDQSSVSAKFVLINSVRATTSENVKKLLDHSIPDTVLESISEVWWQFHSIVKSLFEQRVIPSLRNQDPELLLLNLRTAYKLRPFYQIPSVQHHCTTLDDATICQLKAEVTDLLNKVTSTDRNKAAQAPGRKQLVVEDTEMDDDQKAYLDQLQDDDEMELEELEEEFSDSAAGDEGEQIAEACSLILKSLPNNQPQTATSQIELLPSLNHVKVSALTTEQEIQQVSRTACETLRSETSLSALLLALDILGQLLQSNIAQIQYSKACESLLPHMKQNKSFLQTIKVGNMTQTIDEGLTFRTMTYSTLLQVLTTHPVDYTVSCKILMESLSRGVRDTDPTINQLSIRVIEALLQKNYEIIKGIDPEWYNTTLVPRVLEISTKISKRLQASQDMGQGPDASARTVINVVDQLNHLIDSRYPAIP